MTECSQCGDCCDRIFVGKTYEEMKEIAYRVEPAPHWENWVPYHESILSARFALNVWTVNETGPGWVRYDCPRFNRESRTCEAHDERPPVCSGFPWYGGKPDPFSRISGRCSFNADVRNMLPIVSINGNPQ